MPNAQSFQLIRLSILCIDIIHRLSTDVMDMTASNNTESYNILSIYIDNVLYITHYQATPDNVIHHNLSRAYNDMHIMSRAYKGTISYAVMIANCCAW